MATTSQREQGLRPVLTTNRTIGAHLEASVRRQTRNAIEARLLEIGHPEDDAACYAAIVERFMDPDLYEAHVMLVADALFKAAHPKADRRLITEPIETRGRYVRKALKAVSLVREALQGQRDPAVLQAAADFAAHRHQAAQASRLRAVIGGSK